MIDAWLAPIVGARDIRQHEDATATRDMIERGELRGPYPIDPDRVAPLTAKRPSANRIAAAATADRQRSVPSFGDSARTPSATA